MSTASLDLTAADVDASPRARTCGLSATKSRYPRSKSLTQAAHPDGLQCNFPDALRLAPPFEAVHVRSQIEVMGYLGTR